MMSLVMRDGVMDTSQCWNTNRFYELLCAFMSAREFFCLDVKLAKQANTDKPLFNAKKNKNNA